MLGILLLSATSILALPTRRALVLGNDSYPGNRLRNARNDAKAVGAAFGSLGYVTTIGLDTDRAEMSRVIEMFVRTIESGDAAIVYYAGHGLQVEGENYLVPTDFRVSDASDVRVQGYSLSTVMEKLIAHGATTQIIILDACRDNPFSSVRSVHEGWAKTATSAGSFLAFGTSPGSTASDDPADTHGLFTKSLLAFLADPSLDIEQLFQRVRQQVILSSNAQQVPWTASSLVGSFHIVPGSDADAPVVSTARRAVGNQQVAVRSIPDVVGGGERRDVSPQVNQLIGEARLDLRSFNLDHAFDILQAVLSLDPRCSVAFRLLGVVLHLMGRSSEADKALRSAVNLDPKDSIAYTYRCLIEAGDQIVDAKADCDKAMTLRRDLAPAHLGLAINLLAIGSKAEAYYEASEAIRLDPGSAPSHALRGKVAALQGQDQSSLQDYTTAAKLAAAQPK